MKNTQMCKDKYIMAEGVCYHVKVIGKGRPLVWLHGFSEDSTTWNKINIPGYESFFVDLIGHGKSERKVQLNYYMMESVLKQLETVINELISTCYSIIGYSMGGRLALAYALRHRENIEKLVLESSGFGIKDRCEKNKRRNSEKKLAENIKKEGIIWFEEYWSKLDIFSTQLKLDKQIIREIKKRRLNNSEVALANTLLGLGQGVSPYYGMALQGLQIPTIYVSGELDKKYVELGKEIEEINVNIKSYQIEGAGHNVHLERATNFTRVIAGFLSAETF